MLDIVQGELVRADAVARLHKQAVTILVIKATKIVIMRALQMWRKWSYKDIANHMVRRCVGIVKAAYR